MAIPFRSVRALRKLQSGDVRPDSDTLSPSLAAQLVQDKIGEQENKDASKSFLSIKFCAAFDILSFSILSLQPLY